MKKNLQFLFFVFLGAFLIPGVQGQQISAVTFSPTPALACSTITVNTAGSLNCANMALLGSAHTTVGSIISVRIDLNIGIICLPAIVPFNRAHFLTNTNPGTYRLTVNTYLNNVFADSMSTQITIGACCQVNTQFTSSATAVCPGDSITFRASNSALLNYGWKIDGAPVTGGMTIGRRFQTAGTYDIKLVGNDSTCLDSTTATVQVASFPAISFPASVMENCPGSMDGSIQTMVSGGIGAYTYSWSSGDTSANLANISGGNYVLSVSDGIGCTSQDTFALATGAPVVAGFIPSKTSQICPGEMLNFTNTSSNSSNYVWKKDGQIFSTDTNTTYIFTDTGTFDIVLLADDGPACTDSVSMSFTVSGPTADFTASAPIRACPDEEVILTNTSLAANIFTWQSGGQSFATTSNAQISFSQQNTYDITLIASDGNCADTTSIAINISAPAASFSSSRMSPICPGDFAVLTNTSTNNVNNWWYADTSQFSTNGNAVYTFNDPGMVEVKLVIKDDRCFDSTSMTFSVNALPTVVSDVQDETCTGDLNGTINLTVSGGVAPFVYSWSNGAATRSLANLTAGTYMLTIRDSDGCERNESYVVNTLGGLTADFSSIQTANGLQFTDMSDTTATRWSWDFGDGNTSSSQSPSHSYTFNGRYVVCLIATDRFGCADTTCDSLDVATSIDEVRFEQLQVYPNPAEDAVFINLEKVKGKVVWIRLTDQIGREIRVEKGIADDVYELDLAMLPQAIYLLYVEAKDRTFFAKIVKK